MPGFSLHLNLLIRPKSILSIIPYYLELVWQHHFIEISNLGKKTRLVTFDPNWIIGGEPIFYRYFTNILPIFYKFLDLSRLPAIKLNDTEYGSQFNLIAGNRDRSENL